MPSGVSQIFNRIRGVLVLLALWAALVALGWSCLDEVGLVEGPLRMPGLPLWHSTDAGVP